MAQARDMIKSPGKSSVNYLQTRHLLDGMEKCVWHEASKAGKLLEGGVSMHGMIDK